MSSTLDKVHILKSVSIFSDAPDESLEELTSVLEEVEVQAGETIISRGDIGTCMFVIVDGMVRVHCDEHTVAHLRQGDVFGEMSVLDTERRVASVTAVEDSYLFRIDQQPLYELMSRRVEVVRGIIHHLCQMLRSRLHDMDEDFRYMQQFARVTAAATAVEAGVFQPESLDEVALRTDALGQLARVFQRMTREVQAREQRLKQELQVLRIEIDRTRTASQVAEITDTDFFRELQSKVKYGMRRRNGGG